MQYRLTHSFMPAEHVIRFYFIALNPTQILSYHSMCSFFLRVFIYAPNFTYYALDFKNYACMLKATKL